MLSVQYSLCFTKMCQIGRIFDKNPFILGNKLNNVLKNLLRRVEKEKYSFLEKTCSSLQPACLELHREEPSSQDKLSLQKQYSLGLDSGKNRQQMRTGEFCLLQYFQLHDSTCLILGLFFVLENKHSLSFISKSQHILGTRL